MVFGLYEDDALEQIIKAAARVRVEASKQALSLVEHFLRFDPASHGTLNGKTFYYILRMFGLPANDCDLMCRRFSANCTDWSCDYLDFCRCVELSDDAAVACLVARLTHGLNTKSLREPFLEADVRSTGNIPVRNFRSIILYDWQADATELQLQLLSSRFAHPCEANLVAYRPFLEFLDTDAVSPSRFRRLDRNAHYDDKRYWRDSTRSRFNNTSPRWSPLARYRSDFEKTEPIPLLRNDKARHMYSPKGKLHRESCGAWRGSACSPRHRVFPSNSYCHDDEDDGWRDHDGCVDHTTRKNPRGCGASVAHVSSRDDPVAADMLQGRSARGVRSAEELCVKVNGGRWACPVCCNTENSRSSDSCFICGAHNPHLRGTAVLLECPQCNYINPDSADTCDICNFQLRSRQASRASNSESMVQSADGWRTEAVAEEKKPSRWSVDKIPENWRSRFSPQEKEAWPHSPRIKELDYDD